MANIIDEQSVIVQNLVQRVDIESMIRPESIKNFNKVYDDYPYDFPSMVVPGTNHVWTQDPIDTRTNLQNKLIIRRHFDK